MAFAALKLGVLSVSTVSLLAVLLVLLRVFIVLQYHVWSTNSTPVDQLKRASNQFMEEISWQRMANLPYQIKSFLQYY